MPEGPECKILGRALNEVLAGKTLVDVQYDEKSRYSKSSIVNHQAFLAVLPLKIERVYSRGKKIIFQLEKGYSMLSSLAMEGHWLLEPDKHSNLWIAIRSKNEENSKDVQYIWFDDSRHFGTFEIQMNPTELTQRLSDLGPDLLSDEVTLADWMAKVRNKRIKNKQICDFLMDQSRFCGIGNYLKSDILYHARIRPDRTVSEISDAEHARIFTAAREIIQKSYQCGGCTLRTYWSIDGTKGTYEPLVYGRKTDAYGNPVVTATFKDKRNSWFVENLQV